MWLRSVSFACIYFCFWLYIIKNNNNKCFYTNAVYKSNTQGVNFFISINSHSLSTTTTLLRSKEITVNIKWNK